MVLAVITARLSNHARIPNKILAPICGRPILGWILDRLQKTLVHKITLAIPEGDDQEELWRWGNEYDLSITAGSPEDVIDRLAQCAWENQATKVIRITGDLPFLSYEGIDDMIEALSKDVDYVNNFYGLHPMLDGTSAEIAWDDVLGRGNRLMPYGMAKEMHKVHGGVDGTWRSHGMYWIANCGEFRVKAIGGEEDVTGLPHVLVDEPADLKVAEFVMGKVIEAKDDSYHGLVKILRAHKQEIEEIRAH